jgi:PST family polysaccharide transporter/lipopolysaccharide exporter
MFLIEAAGQLASVLVGILLAVIYQSVWALVLSAIANHLVQLFMSYLVSPSRPRFVWDWSIVRYHLRYGRQILATAITQYSYNNGDDWFVGKFMGESALGFYGKAYQFGNMPTTELTLVLGRVLFPSFSKLKNEEDRLGKAFLRIQRLLSLLVAPVTAMLFFFARPFVQVVLGNKWLPVLSAFRLLIVWGGIRALRETVVSVFRATGWPALVAWTTLGKLVLMVALLWSVRGYGIAGVGAVVLLTSVLEFPILMWFVARQLKISYFSLYRPMWVPGIAAFFIGFIASMAAIAVPPIVRLFEGWGLTVMGYTAAMIVIERVFHPDQFAEPRRLCHLVRAKWF